MRVFELLEKDIYFFSKRKKKAVRILCKFFPYNSVFVKVKFNQSNCSILEISAPHVTTNYVYIWPPCIPPFDGQSPHPPPPEISLRR